MFFRIVFQPMKMKNPRLASEREEAGCEALSPEHRELVTWVHRGWSSVKTEMERGEHKGLNSTLGWVPPTLFFQFQPYLCKILRTSL